MALRKPNPRNIQPDYPTRRQLLAQPGLLQEHLPPAWKAMLSKGGLTVAFLVSGLAAVPSGCGPASASAGTAIVAPIFDHGTGRAATGCIVISPPVFMTEEEARQIIIEELGKAGLKMSAKDVELKNVGIRPRKFGTVTKDGKTEFGEVPGDPHPLVVDLMDPGKHIAVEFISQSDYYELGGEMSMSTVQEFDFKKVGQEVVDQIKTTTNANLFGVFYDPAPHEIPSPALSADERKGKTEAQIFSEALERERTAATNSSQEDLRKQVRDFAEWLRQRGVL